MVRTWHPNVPVVAPFDRVGTIDRKGIAKATTTNQSIAKVHGGQVWQLNDAAAGVSFRSRLPVAGAQSP